MSNFVVVLVVLVIVALAGAYVIRAKKKGQKCIGCPYSASCQQHCSCCGEHQA